MAICLFWLDENRSGFGFILTQLEEGPLPPPKCSFHYAAILGGQNHVKVARMVMAIGVVARHVWLCLPIKTSKRCIAKQHSLFFLSK